MTTRSGCGPSVGALSDLGKSGQYGRSDVIARRSLPRKILGRMPTALSISPHGRLFVEESGDGTTPSDGPLAKRLRSAFGESAARGLLHLATAQLPSQLSPDFALARDLPREYLTRLCHAPPAEEGAAASPAPVPPPTADELGAMALRAPPMRGLEYLRAEMMAAWWAELDALVREEAAAAPGAKQGLKWGMPAETVEVDISGVELVELVARSVATQNEALPVTWGDAALRR